MFRANILNRVVKLASYFSIRTAQAHTHDVVSKGKFDLRNYPDVNWTDIHKPDHFPITWAYRDTSDKSNKKEKIIAELLMATMWYWILWHIYFDTEHLVGHYEHPDPEKWSNEELGIPSDDS